MNYRATIAIIIGCLLSQPFTAVRAQTAPMLRGQVEETGSGAAICPLPAQAAPPLQGYSYYGAGAPQFPPPPQNPRFPLTTHSPQFPPIPQNPQFPLTPQSPQIAPAPGNPPGNQHPWFIPGYAYTNDSMVSPYHAMDIFWWDKRPIPNHPQLARLSTSISRYWRGYVPEQCMVLIAPIPEAPGNFTFRSDAPGAPRGWLQVLNETDRNGFPLYRYWLDQSQSRFPNWQALFNPNGP